LPWTQTWQIQRRYYNWRALICVLQLQWLIAFLHIKRLIPVS
jgi:hypothetical protein